MGFDMHCTTVFIVTHVTLFLTTHRIVGEDDTFPVHPDQFEELVHVLRAVVLFRTANRYLRTSVVERAVGIVRMGYS